MKRHWALTAVGAGLVGFGAWKAWRRRAATRAIPAGERERRVVDEVSEASMESFPASDPPAYTPTVGSRVKRSY